MAFAVGSDKVMLWHMLWYTLCNIVLNCRAQDTIIGNKKRQFYDLQLTKKIQISIAKNWKVLQTHPELKKLEDELVEQR